MAFTDGQIAHALEKPGVLTIEDAVCQLLMDTTPVTTYMNGKANLPLLPLSFLGGTTLRDKHCNATEDSPMSHSDLRRLNLDTMGCLIEALTALDGHASKADRRTLFDLLCRVDSLYREVGPAEAG